jgi:hypothetical protein
MPSSFVASFYVGTLYLQRILGYGTVAAGAAFLPQTLMVAAFSLGPTAWLVGRFGAPGARHRPCRHVRRAARARRDPGAPAADALVGGYQLGLLVCAGCVAAALLVALSVLRRTRAPAEPVP